MPIFLIRLKLKFSLVEILRDYDAIRVWHVSSSSRRIIEARTDLRGRTRPIIASNVINREENFNDSIVFALIENSVKKYINNGK